jgi:hypothetical protein
MQQDSPDGVPVTATYEDIGSLSGETCKEKASLALAFVAF